MEFLSYFPAVGGLFYPKLEERTNRATKDYPKNQMVAKLFRCNEEKRTEGQPSISHMRCISNPNWHKIIFKILQQEIL